MAVEYKTTDHLPGGPSGWLTTDLAAEKLKITSGRVHQMISEGLIEAAALGGHCLLVRIPAAVQDLRQSRILTMRPDIRNDIAKRKLFHDCPVTGRREIVVVCRCRATEEIKAPDYCRGCKQWLVFEQET